MFPPRSANTNTHIWRANQDAAHDYDGADVCMCADLLSRCRCCDVLFEAQGDRHVPKLLLKSLREQKKKRLSLKSYWHHLHNQLQSDASTFMSSS